MLTDLRLAFDGSPRCSMSPRFRFGKYKPVIAVDFVSTGNVDCGYQTVNALAVLSLLFGVGSIMTILDWSLALVPVAGIGLGILSLRRIHRAPMEIVGVSLAYCGIALSVVLWACGYARLAFVHYWQPPAGYIPTTFSALQPDPNDSQQRVSEESRMLDQRNVYLRGFMHPGRHQTGLREFFLLDDPGVNPFLRPQKRPTQIVRVAVKPPQKIDFVSHEVGVAGKLSVYETDTKNEMGGLVYKIEADIVR